MIQKNLLKSEIAFPVSISCMAFFLCLIFSANAKTPYLSTTKQITEQTSHAPDLFLSIDYQGRFFGIPVMTNRYQLAFYNQQYIVTSNIFTSGLIKWFKKTDIHSESHGSFSAHGIQPIEYKHKNLASRKNRIVRILFDKNHVRSDVSPPFGSAGDPPPTPRQLNQSIDPLSASILLALSHKQERALCENSYTLFDGKLLYTLTLVNQGQDHIKTRVYKGPATRCHIFYQPVAGFDPEDLPKIDISNKPATIWLAKFESYPLVVPVKVSFRIKGWRGIIEAKKLFLNIKN